MAKWFNLMTSRTPVVALSKLNPEVYESTILFLNEFINIFRNIKIGKSWKPCQTGVVIATQTVLDLQDLYLNKKEYKFFLTGRLTQDCLENLFSTLRAVQPIPTALQFKDNLKLICMAQYMKTVSKSNYDEDDRCFLGNFLDNTYVSTSKIILNPDHDDNIEIEMYFKDCETELCPTEQNALYNIAGTYLHFLS